MTCEHDLAEKETACADGLCPLCLSAELAAAQKAGSYPNLDMMERGGCGPTSDWIRVIPEIRALRAELAAAREENRKLRAKLARVVAALGTAQDQAEVLVRRSGDTRPADTLLDCIKAALAAAKASEDKP